MHLRLPGPEESEHKADRPSAQTSPEGEDFQFSGPQKVTEKPFTCNTPQHHQISIAYLSGLWIIFNMGATAPTPPTKCLLGLFLLCFGQ